MSKLSTRDFRASVTNRILAMKFAAELMLLWPVILIMFGERGHVSAAGIGTILATELVLSILFEIPTGVIADKFPRKYVLFCGLAFKALALFVWWQLASFQWYLVAAVCMALSNSLESGALQAYLYGALGADSKQNFGRFWARVSSMVMISYSLGDVLASIIGVNYKLLASISLGMVLIALFFCWILPVDTEHQAVEREKPKIFREALGHIVENRKLFKLLLSGVLVVGIALILVNFMSLYYHQVGISSRSIGLWMAGGKMVGAISFWQLHNWEKSIDRYKLIFTAIALLAFIFSFSGGSIVAAGGSLIFLRWFRLLQVQYESNLQHLSNDKTRATVASIGNFVATILGAGVIWLIGHFASDNQIVKPMRVAIVLAAIVYFLVHGLIRYKERNSGTLVSS